MILLSREVTADQVLAHLQPNELTYPRGVDVVRKRSLSESFKMLNRFTGVDQKEWTLWRVKGNKHLSYIKRRTIVFSFHEQEDYVHDLLDTQRVSLQPSAIKVFCKRSVSESTMLSF